MDRVGLVFDIKKYALHDGPGIRTTVFLKGCPLACPWCHNPEGLESHLEVVYGAERCLGCGLCLAACAQTALSLTAAGVTRDPDRCTLCLRCSAACPTGAREPSGRLLPVSEVFDAILADQLFYDESGGGVTFSGGEPLAQPEFLLALLQRCGAYEFHRCVDTSGHAPWPVLSGIAAHTDLFLYDLKHMDTAVHRALTGVGNGLILDNLKRLDRSGAAIVVRLPLVPGVNDGREAVAALGRFVGTLERVDTLHLLPHHGFHAGKYAKLGRSDPGRRIDPDAGREPGTVADQLRELGLTVQIGG